MKHSIVLLAILFLLGAGLGSVSASRIYFEPGSSELIRGCESNINIMVDPQGEEIYGASVYVSYDPQALEIGGFYISTADFNMPVPVKHVPGELKTILLNYSVDVNGDLQGYTQPFKYGTLKIINKGDQDTATLMIGFKGPLLGGDGADAYAVDTANDTVTSVNYATYTFKEGSCNGASVEGHNMLNTNFNNVRLLEQQLQKVSQKRENFKNNVSPTSYVQIGAIIFIALVILSLFYLFYKQNKTEKKANVSSSKNKKTPSKK